MRRFLISLIILGGASLFLAACMGLGAPTGRSIFGAYRTNGERIYYSGASANGPISYSGVSSGMMGGGGGMMGSSLACADCHGNDARGGVHQMGMVRMDAPDIRWATLTEADHDADGDHDEGGKEMDHPPYDEEAFKRAVTQGIDPAGGPLDRDMPRWRMSDQDIRDLIQFLQNVP